MVTVLFLIVLIFVLRLRPVLFVFLYKAFYSCGQLDIVWR